MPEKPLPPPPTHPDDPPFVCIPINPSWIPYIIGLLRPAKFPEYWSGTLDENRNARRDIQNLIYQFQTALECGEMVTNCCVPLPAIYRIASDGTSTEISYDGGQTWGQNPYDPRLKEPIVTGIPGVELLDCCNAAGATKDAIKDRIEQIGAVNTQNLTFTEIAIIIIGIILILIPVGVLQPEFLIWIIPMVISLVKALVGLGNEAFLAQFTPAVWDAVQCNAFCALGDECLWTPSTFAAFQALNMSQLPNGGLFGVNTNIRDVVNVMGIAELNFAAIQGIGAEYDCSGCECGCTANWTVITGNTVETGDNFVIVSSVDVPGIGQYVEIRSSGDNDCCLVRYELISGAIDVTAYIPCGLPVLLENEVFSWAGTVCARFAAFKSSQAFTVKLVYVGDCSQA